MELVDTAFKPYATSTNLDSDISFTIQEGTVVFLENAKLKLGIVQIRLQIQTVTDAGTGGKAAPASPSDFYGSFATMWIAGVIGGPR